MEGAGQAKHHPDVAVLVGLGAEGVLVVIAADAPLGGYRVEAVRAAVAIAVGQAGELRTLHRVHRALFPEHAERLVLVGGELGPLDLGEVGVVGAFGDPDVAAAGADGDLLAGQERDRGDLGHFAGRRGDLDAFVEFGLAGFGGLDGVDRGELAGLAGLGGIRGGRAGGEAGEDEEKGEVLHMNGFR